MKVALLFSSINFVFHSQMEWTSPRGHRERRREDTSSATLSRKRKAESVPDDESGSSVLSDELLVYLQPTSEDCVRLQEKGISSLKKLFDAYCNRMGIQGASVRWLFYGRRIREHQTPLDVDLEDGDSIDVVVR